MDADIAGVWNWLPSDKTAEVEAWAKDRNFLRPLQTAADWTPLQTPAELEAWREQRFGSHAELVAWRKLYDLFGHWRLQEFQQKQAEAEAALLAAAGVSFPADCENAPGRGYILKHLIAPGDVCAVIGVPGAGKSVLAPYLGYAIAQGRSVFGRRVKQGRVLYVAAEDRQGMGQRVAALRRRFGDAPDFGLMECGNLLDKLGADELRRFVSWWTPAVVIIDTLGAAWAGLEENSAEGMGQVVALSRHLTRDNVAAGGEDRPAVMLVHHTAKQSDGSPRGHSILNGTLDMSMLLERDETGVIRAKLGKNRNGSADLDMAFKIDSAVLGTDEDGDPITAPIACELAAGTASPERLPRTEAAALAVLQDMAAATPDGRVAEVDWLAECDSRRVSTAESPKGRKDVLRRAFAGLRDKGRIAVAAGFVSLPIAAEFTCDSSDSSAIVATVAAA